VEPFYRVLGAAHGDRVELDGLSCTMLGSNNYLGLTHHPEVMQAAAEAIQSWGTGCTGSRAMNGTLALHEELESELADFLGREAALVTSAGILANQAGIAAVCIATDTIFADELSHASIIDAARLSGAKLELFRHSDASDLERRLELRRGRALVVVEGVYSMHGDIAPLRELSDVAVRRGAGLYVDEAHALGVLGHSGRGASELLGVEERVDLVMGTFSKSLASCGGFLAGAKKVIDHVRTMGRPFLFTAALPPASAAAALAALRVVRREPDRRARLARLVARYRNGLEAHGVPVLPSSTPIQALPCGGAERALRRWRALLERGVYANASIPPAVPEGGSLLRTSLTATLSETAVDAAVAAIGDLDWTTP
jgi:8-amino-7-oxononanoate synthase